MKQILLSLLFCLFWLFAFTQNQDCEEALELFTKDSITVTELLGIGDIDEIFDNECVSDFGFGIESNSSWYEFKPVQSGTFNFIIKPLDPTNDLDFYMFSTVTGFCSGLVSIRCNASSCDTENGHTGLSEDDTDLFEDLNCDEGENLFSSEVMLEEGEKYYLMVNNFTGNAGYTITFCGTALLSDDDVVCTRDPSSTTVFSEKTYAIFPNPTSGEMKISDAHEIDLIDVFSVDGRHHLQVQNPQDRLSMDLNPGMYYMKMSLKNGKIATTPFVMYK